MSNKMPSPLWQEDTNKAKLAKKKDVLKAGTLLGPTPVVMVTTCGTSTNEEGETVEKDNVFTIAWGGTINSDPPMLSISVRPERLSWTNLEQHPEFVVNLVNRELAVACDYCGVVSGRDRNKAEDMHLTYVKAEGLEHAKAIAESPLTLSCKVARTIPLGSHILVLAHILAIEADETLMDDKGALQMQKADLIAYLHGHYYGLDHLLGFFGYSVARPEILRERMPEFVNEDGEIDLSAHQAPRFDRNYDRSPRRFDDRPRRFEDRPRRSEDRPRRFDDPEDRTYIRTYDDKGNVTIEEREQKVFEPKAPDAFKRYKSEERPDAMASSSDTTDTERQDHGSEHEGSSERSGDRSYEPRDRSKQRDDRNQRPFKRDNRDNRGGDRPYNRDNRDNRGGDRPFNRDNRDNRGGDRPYNRDNRDNRGGDRPYNRDNRDNRGGDRPFNHDNRDNRNSDRPFNRDNRGGDRPFNSNNRGGDRPFNRDGRTSRPEGRGGFRSDPRRGPGERRDHFKRNDQRPKFNREDRPSSPRHEQDGKESED